MDSIDSNNLCIPEDAFEQFQSVSMYQEEEYITLGEIVPAKPKEPDPEFSHVSYDNEVIVTTEDEVNSTVNDNTEEVESGEQQNLNDSYKETNEQSDEGLIISEQDNEPKPRDNSCKEKNEHSDEGLIISDQDHEPKLQKASRRGRKKKYVVETEKNTVSNNALSSEQDSSDNKINTDHESPIISSTVVSRKRGRKPKPKPLSAEPVVPLGTSQEFSNISNTPFSSDPENSDTNIAKKKRGRPRKVLVPNDQPNSKAISYMDTSELSSSDNYKNDNLLSPSKLEIRTKGKRGRPRKISLETNIDQQVKQNLENEFQLVDIYGTQSTECYNSKSLETDVAKIEQEHSDEKLALNSNSKPKSDAGYEISSVFSEDDDLDDISLSKLKEQPDIGKSHHEVSEKNEGQNTTNSSFENICSPLPNLVKKEKGRPKRKKQGCTKKNSAEILVKSEPIVENITSNNDTQIAVDETDDLSLSKLKKMENDTVITTNNSTTEVSTTVVVNLELEICPDNVNETASKCNTKMPVMSDFEYNIDSLVEKDTTVNDEIADNDLLMEDTSKRPKRRKVPKLQYDEGSDEDPFANIELSDDDEPRRRKGNKYYSDDEYIPGRRGCKDIDSTDSEAEVLLDEAKKQRRRKFSKKSENQSPHKKEKADDQIHNLGSDDVEICLRPTVIKTSDDSQSQPSQTWGSTNEFENFLAKKIQGTNLKIKKLSAKDPTENKTLKIPVFAPEARKSIEMCSQTNIIHTVSTGVQTNVPYDIPMKENITLTPQQSEKACYFLNSIVRTTSELGTLMTQKSEDFIKKKINTTHVTDTMKMDYCVKKSFLLFKLAKHNLMQMEEDLAKQYDDFLKSNNLSACREAPKEVVASAKPASSDSDCEIVEEPVKPTSIKKSQVKPKFNPKTVFLNKELSIKIAKKPTENKKLDIKGRHTVWINDTVLVKKVKPTQSFLAQDSRNKKPPDNIITTKMVSDFFKNYYRQKAISVCAPFISTDWLNVGRDCVCNYFVTKPVDQFNNNVSYPGNGEISTTSNATTSVTNHVVKHNPSKHIVSCPETLLKMCFRIVKTRMNGVCQIKEVCQYAQNKLTDEKNKPVTLVQLTLRAITGKADTILEASLPPPKKKPAENKTLLQLCLNVITSKSVYILETNPSPWKNQPINDTEPIVPPLKTLSHQRIVALLHNLKPTDYSGEHQSIEQMKYSTVDTTDSFSSCSSSCSYPSITKKYKVKSLICLCVEHIQLKQALEISNNSIFKPKLLKCLAFEHVKKLLYGQVAFYETSCCHSNQQNDEIMIEGLTINSVNTLSEEAFLSLEQSHPDSPDNPEYLDDYDDEGNYDNDYAEAEDNQTETSWVSQVQMQEPRSCVNINSSVGQAETSSIVTQIKLEPLDNIIENVDTPVNIKSELCPGPDEMTVIPHVKAEVVEHIGPGPIQRQDSTSYDVDAFEQFVASNKLMHALNEDDIFSQSALRVHRQHEPDYELDDMSMSLLVPQTYEPLSIDNVKGSLMESSSDEGSSKTKKVAKKKPDKRHKGKQKKVDPKTTSKETPTLTKEKAGINEVATLTKRMRDRIRQEEKKDDSTDSDDESSMPLRLRNRKDQEKSKPAQTTHTKESEIQCSNVDSTDQVDDNIGSFTGFTAIDQNEISTYQKYMKYVYDKIIPAKEEEISKIPPYSSNDSRKEIFEEPLIAANQPVELLECEPTMPIFDDEIIARKSSRKNKVKEIINKKELAEKTVLSRKEDILKEGETSKTGEIPTKEVTFKMNEIIKRGVISKMEDISKREETLKKDNVLEESPLFVERHGWKCYPVNPEDSKLYQTAKLILEKLPETFVQVYMEYQGVTRKDESDEEIDRLTNLNSLNRGGQMQNLNKSKIKSRKEGKDENAADAGSRPESPTYSDHYELEPSDDEGAKVEDETAPPVAQRHTENTLAKNLLMDDNDSDCEGSTVKVKQETSEHMKSSHSKGSKSKKKEDVVVEDSADLMLTADKMMNKELTLLHAPVVPTSDVKNIPSTGPVTRNKQKSASKNQSSTSKIKNEEDSSSEEEKQWVTTKEKLLKRVSKKDHTSLDDAKRAKLVSEFIERRTDFPDSYKRGRTKPRRSSKKFLERQKQLRVLSRELFGESSDSYMSKRSQKAQASLLYKGRRNIRKVIDKKSLARSTVVANMEEFERKRRLNSRQTKLRELLGCEEGVNVLVINDEVCLEYDFEENRPVVTVHPFFTKVMKAHQYEGVKFMWDACFESLAEIKAGHPGGGCILAHCMGLGKTLQVLALLHTVLTHPGVRMQRVLVCCPLSTVLNWVDEIHKWIGPVTNQIKVFELSKLKKTYERAYQLEDWYNGGGIFIIGYELFRSLTTLDPFLDDVRPTIINKIRTALLDPGPDIIVCDEGHLLKNDCSVLAVAMSRVVTKRRIILTGTPMQNNLREYYCMVNFVKPNLLGTYAEYSNRFENPIMNGQHRDSIEEDIKLMKARTHILHKVLEGCLQRQEASVLYPYLPKKYEYTVFISLTPCQWDLYKHYLNNYGKNNKQSVLKDFHILQKIWSHPQVLHNFQTKARDRDEKNKIKVEKLEDDLATEDIEDIKPNAVEDLWWLEYLEGGKMLETLDSSNKFIVVFRILDECVALGDKVLIFSTSLFCLDALEYFLKKINKWSLGQEYFRLDGSVPAEVRQNWCREFNSDNNYKTKLFLVSTRAGCLGLNMTAANRVIIMDTSWNPAHDIQSIFRVYRFGQKKDCYIYRLVAMGTMEQKIYERSVTKQAVACRVVDEQQIDRHYNMAELTELYKFNEGVSCVAGGVAAGVRDVALLRVARDAAAALHAVHEHDSLLRGSGEQGLPEHERNAAWMQFQQEHTHKQMENKLIINIPSVSMKRAHGHDYALIPAPAANNTNENTNNDLASNEPKAKKGRKAAILKCNIPIQEEDNQNDLQIRGRTRRDATSAIPSTSKDFTDINEPPYNASQTLRAIINDEELMVEKITSILLRYNFQYNKSNTEVSNLVSKVRNMVKKGYVDCEDMSDELTANIAKVLLPNQLGLPKITDIMCESINNSVAPKAQPSGACPELITGDYTSNYSVFTHQKKSPIESGLRTRRKAALQAAKSMDSLAQDVIINLDDDYDSRDADFVPARLGKSQKTQIVANDKSKRKSKTSSPVQPVSDSDEATLSASPPPENDDFNNSAPIVSIRDQSKDYNKPKQTHTHKKRLERPTKDVKQVESKKQENKTVEIVPSTSTTDKKENSKSILLSDDDEPISNLAKPAEKPVVAPTEKPPETPEKNEVVPLPTSLLKNQNFINIVAHTYLVGNPMLDEDAATLAAQYSTLKALKEAERTGQDVCSGPIYDIAVKVIGKDILKKLRSVNPKAASSSAEDAAASIQKKEKMIADEKFAMEQARSPKDLRDNMIMEKLGLIKPTAPEVTPSITVKPPGRTINKVVVPVGLIKTSASMSVSQSFGAPQLSGERVEPRVECILPDDDDVIISDVRATPVPPPASHAPYAAPPAPHAPYAAPQAPHALYAPPPAPHAPHAPLQAPHAPYDVSPPAAQAPHRPPHSAHVTPSTRATKPALNNKKRQVTETQPIRVTVGNSVSQSQSTIILKPYVPPPVILNSTLAASPGNIAMGPVAAQRVVLKENTICLDSDEDETVTPTARPLTSSVNSMAPPHHLQLEPVPVSLTMANAPGVNLPLPPLQSFGPTQTLVLRQVPTPNGTQTKYVLVPTDKMPIPIAPKPPIPEKSKQYSSQPPPVSIQPLPSSTQSFTPSTQPTLLNSFQNTSGNSIISAKNTEFGHSIKKACKPGDILRISKTGVIEVINRSEIMNIPSNPPVEITNVVATIPESTTQTSTSQFSSTITTSEAPKSKTSTSVNDTYKGPSQNKVDASRERQISSSSSNSSSRPVSPENPLSILQNVVQIQAADYKSTKISKKNKSDNSHLRTKKSNKYNVSVEHVVSSDFKSKDTNASKSLIKLTPVPKDKIPKHIDSAMEKQMKKDALMKKITPLLTKNQRNTMEEIKPRGRNTISFDNLNSATTSKLLKGTSKPIDKKGGTIGFDNLNSATTSKLLKGTSKPIEKKGGSSSSKSVVTVDLTHLVADGMTVMKTKRQASSSDPAPVKKKRTAPMTLKDFNLDDIDDIIELE